MNKIRRLIFLVFFTIFVLTEGTNTPSFAQEMTISVLVDGLPVSFDVPPIIKDGRTLVPFRAVSEVLNVPVSWDEKSKIVTASDGGAYILLRIGDKTAYLNNTQITLDVPPMIMNGRMLIPLRFFSEAFGCNVEWDNASYTVRIVSPRRKMAIIGFYALGDSRTSSWTNLFGKPYPEHSKGNTDAVSELALGWYSLDKDGSLLTQSATGWQRPSGWEDVLKAASLYNLRTEMVIHATDSKRDISELISSKEAMEKLAEAIAEESKLYSGVNLDLEGLGLNEGQEKLLETRQNFVQFIRILSEKLDPTKTLTLTLHAPNSAYKGYDYKALSAIADRIIIMAYDYGSSPEPVDKVLQAIEMAKTEVPAEKLILGISMPRETAESLLTKIGIAKRYNLSGIALWRLGLVTKDQWEVLRKAVEPVSFHDIK
ncbi:Copper amine oxidase N-terminal domain-containing protein [Caldanaerovirga acetigignens]|uniref:Copper amine oxidase N-terminal domain-containing protein n=1 Tax=Caldanaerovirga acetigignens TaxID=447595 RepID=A0A1M7LT48_9FIRM|nr:stalk domain-containing protein [Caldanaerovirga acetigignens]SHM81336.1 Copper amine oxidase N-terminal domain-containing protein [Caldanaerovirga acetigignens]